MPKTKFSGFGGAARALADSGEAVARLSQALNDREAARQALTPQPVRPMLCQRLECRRETMRVLRPLDAYAEGWSMETKLDGNRVIVATWDGQSAAWSRPGPGKTEGLPRPLPPQVKEALRSMPDGLWDGELYAGGSSSDVGRHDLEPVKQLYLFDVVALQGQSTVRYPYAARRELLETAVAPSHCEWIQLVERMPVSHEALMTIWDSGGEGIVLKRDASFYEPGKRSWNWLKVTALLFAELTVVKFLPGKTGRNAGVPMIRVELRDDAGGKCTAGCPAVLRDPSLVGKRVMVEYKNRTENGSYRMPQIDRVV